MVAPPSISDSPKNVPVRQEVASPLGPTAEDLVRRFKEGDRVYYERPQYEGDNNWRCYTVSDAGDDWVEFGGYRLEVDEDVIQNVRVAETPSSTLTTDSESLPGGLERLPESDIPDELCEWEVHLQRIREPDSIHKQREATVFPEAVTREEAIKTAKRWAEMQTSVRVLADYNNGPVFED